MTDLQVRRIPFEFDETVPFQWHPTNPEFGLMMNAVSFLVIGFERYIVAAVRDALPLIDDEHVAEEADAFMRQEAVHAHAHRGHVKAMIRQFPPLQGTLDAALASYDHLLATKPLEFHLAYIADMEATFTPNFKLFLDNCDELFEPGDRRVASLFAVALRRGDRASQLRGHRLRQRGGSTVVPAPCRPAGQLARAWGLRPDHRRLLPPRAPRGDGDQPRARPPASRSDTAPEETPTGHRSVVGGRRSVSPGVQRAFRRTSERLRCVGCSVRNAPATTPPMNRFPPTRTPGSRPTTEATT